MTIWLVSDTHFSHSAIIGYCGRPFANADEMDDAMIARWNDTVKPSDHIYHLGDVAMKVDVMRRIVPLLNGHKRLIRGNHDIFKTKDYIKAGFEEIHGMRVFDDVVLTHVPIHERSLKQRWLGNIHGHIHEQPSFGPRYLNISVEQTDYTPISLDEARVRLIRQIGDTATIAAEIDAADRRSDTIDAEYAELRRHHDH